MLGPFAFLFLSVASLWASPPVITNWRGYQLPAENLLIWKATGAAYYKIYSAGDDLRWRFVATNLTAPIFHDTDYLSLPTYYRIVAVSSSGEVSASSEIVVNVSDPRFFIGGVNVRPSAENVTRLDYMMTKYEPTGYVPASAAAILELGLSSTNLTWVSSNPESLGYGSFLLTNLQPGTVYWYRLTCLGTNGAAISYLKSFTAQPYVEPPVVSIDPFNLPTSLYTDENTPIRFILTNDTMGIDFNACSYVIAHQPYSGQVTGTSPEFVYTPDLERCCGDGFAWGLFCDGTIVRNDMVNVYIRPVNAAPIALDTSWPATEDSPIELGVNAFDSDWEPTVCRVLTGPTNGTIWNDSYRFFYMSNTNFNGIDHVTFTANDGKVDGNIATIRIHVYPVNDPPQAQDLHVTIVEGEHTVISLPGSDIDGDTLNYSFVTHPEHDRFALLVNGLLIYHPYNYTGPDSFTYKVSDGFEEAYANVYITIVPPNNPPVANPLSLATEFNIPAAVTLSGSDPDGDAIAYQIASGPSYGTLSGTGPSLVYTPNPGFSGTDSFTFVVNDGQTNSLLGTVTITVSPENAPPFAPSNLLAPPIMDHQVILTWTDHSGLEKGFRIERATDGVTFKQIAAVGENVCTFTDNGVRSDKVYYYRVCAYNKQGQSAYSNIASTDQFSDPYPYRPKK